MILLEKDEPTVPASCTCYNSRALNKIAAVAIQFIVLAKDYEKREFTAHCFVVKNHKIRRMSRDDAIMTKLLANEITGSKFSCAFCCTLTNLLISYLGSS